MNLKSSMKSSSFAIALCLLAIGVGISAIAAGAAARTFSTPEEAAKALIQAAETFDVPALEAILGPDGKYIIHSGEPARDPAGVRRQRRGRSPQRDHAR